MNDQFLTELQNVMGGSGIFMEEPMKKHTSFKIGGNADIFIKISDLDDLKNILKFINENKTLYATLFSSTFKISACTITPQSAY